MQGERITKSPTLELAIAKGVVSEKRLEMLVRLPPGYVSVLWAKLELLPLLREGKKVTYRMIAQKAGVSERTVESAMADERFHEAYRTMLKSKLRGSIDIYITHLERLASEGHFRAIKLLLEMSEMYRPVQRIESISMNIDKRELGRMMPDEAKREIVKQWKNLGWTLEEFEMIWETPQEDTSRVLSQK